LVCINDLVFYLFTSNILTTIKNNSRRGRPLCGNHSFNLFKFMSKLLFIKISKILAIAMVLLSGPILTPVLAQNNTPQTVETEQYTGQLTKKENNTLSITKDNTVNQYNVVSEIKIKRDGTSSSLDKLQAGDMLLVTQNKNTKELLSVDVVSKGILDNSMVAIAIIIGLLLLAGLLYYLMRKSDKSIIRTMNSN
jgi:hypothetical protein